MDQTIVLALIAAISPIALALVGFWLNRKAVKRTEVMLDATAGNHAISLSIEQKVDGTLAQAVTDLASARKEINELTTNFALFQQQVGTFLRTGAGGAALKDAIPKS